MDELFADFLKKTDLPNLSPSPERAGSAPQPPLELPWPEEAELIALPAPADLAIPPADLRQVIEQRRSVRHYDLDAPLSLEELSYLLWLTQGVKRLTKRPSTLRTVPSAGARHAFETYLAVNRVSGLEPGLYRFIATRHALLRQEAPSDLTPRLALACGQQEHILQSTVTFIWMAVGERMRFRYVERSLRYLFLDAGHVCQNLYLAAESIGCGVCAMGSFFEEQLNGLIGADGKDHFAIYLASVGKKINQ